jgi:peptide/nickel transport system substrate-binding protein
MTRLPTGSLLAGLLLAGLLAQAPAPAAAQTPTTLRVGIQDDPDALDPATSGTYAGRFIFAAMCDKLVDIGPDLAIVPQLATAWDTAPDGRSLTLTLRQGVTFHDGTPFDAEAVRFNIARMQTMPDSRRKAELSPISDVEVLAPDRVRLLLKAPFAPLLSVLSDRAGMMVSPAAAARSDFAANPVCAGPYRFASRKARDEIRLEKYAGHYDAARHGYNVVRYIFVPDTTVRLSRLRAGDLDVGERLAPTDLRTLREDRGLRLHAAPGLGVSHLMVNVGNGERANAPLARDARIRRALELSIDRTVINRVAFSGENTPDNQMLPPKDPFRSDSHPMPKRDIAAAKALLAEAGATAVPVEITFENTPTDARVAQIIQSMAKEAGFDIRLAPLETASAIQRYLSGNFEAYIGNWSGRSDPDGTLYAFFACEGGQNVNKYCNRSLQDLLDKARAETDTARRRALYGDATAAYLSDLPTIPLYHPNWFIGARADVGGITVYPDGLLRLSGVAPAR